MKQFSKADETSSCQMAAFKRVSPLPQTHRYLILPSTRIRKISCTLLLQHGKSYMVEGTTCSWSGYLRIWSEITRIPASYKQVSLAEYVDATPDKELGREVWDMWDYCTDPGYDGGNSTLYSWYPKGMYLSLFIRILVDLRITHTGLNCPITSLEEWVKKED